ncbi:PUR family DNA/RNA-binding protein, partial [Salibacteraceae bacterium]|nr:PUR family DNA/RNA-binding protein [Salibacteraceae bacterium]
MDNIKSEGLSRNNEDIFEQIVRAGKRTYFFDVKATRSNDYYL